VCYNYSKQRLKTLFTKLKRALIILFVLLVAASMAMFMFIPLTSAQEELATSTGTNTGGVRSDVSGILPGNPFYFVKEWGRNLKRTFVLDPLKRAEFELNVTLEKGEELERVSLLKLNSQEAVERALTNYEGAMARLQKRLEELKETSDNPNVDELLQKLAERTEEHRKLFEDLSNKFETLRGRLQDVQGKWDEVVSPLLRGIGDLDQLMVRLEEVAGEGGARYGEIMRIIERVKRELKTEKETGVTAGNNVAHSDVREGENTEQYWTEERMRDAEPYPMPTLDAGRLNSIMPDVKDVLKLFRIGQTKYDIQPIICADVYIPVCGEDGEIYSNECYATRANVNVAYEGECRE